jgi:hypothetical protein
VDIKSLETTASQYYFKIVLEVLFVQCRRWNARWHSLGDREQSGKGASSSENVSAAEGSLDKLSD